MAAARRRHRRQRGTGGIAGDRPQREIRFGLVLYGGVSLAIYIYGVALEFARLVRASQAGEDNAYAGLLHAADASAIVDIVSGASAGGINGVLLGKALAAGGDIEAVRSLWVDEADIERLMHEPADADPRSLLRSSRFAELITAGLEAMDREGRGDPLVPVFDLFAAGTRVRPWVRALETDLGTVIADSDYRERFHMRLRTEYVAGEQRLGYRRNDFGAEHNAALASVARATSAFPAAFEPVEARATADDLAAGKPDPSYFADGGILHNKPFTEAVSTILTRAADGPVQRWLVSVEPDPEHAKQPRAGAPEVTEIVSKALFGIPRYESVAADVERLDEHREHVRRAKEIIAELDAALAKRLRRRTGTRSLHEAIPYDYAHQRRLQFAGELAERTGEDRDTLGALLSNQIGPLERADAAFDRRRIQHLLEIVRGDFDGAPPEDLERLRELKWRLWGDAERIEDLLWRLFDDPAHPRAPYPVVGEALAAGLHDIRRDTWATCAALDGVVGDRRADAHPPYTVVFDEFELWDMVLLPLEQVSSVGARDRIGLARVSPEDATFTGKPPADKLAGDTLAHFGGFLKREWRTNDVLWGRLDAAEQITRIVLAARAPGEEELAGHIRAVQEEIAREELPDLEGDYVEYLNTRHTVGSETLDAVPAAQRRQLLLRSGDVLRSMSRGVERRDPKNPLSIGFGALGAIAGVLVFFAKRPWAAWALAAVVVAVVVALVVLAVA